MQSNGDSGQAFLAALTIDTGIAHLGVDKILLGPDHISDATIPVERPGGHKWSERLRG